VRDPRFDAVLGAHRAEPPGKIALVAGDNPDPQCVMMARGTPSFAHQPICTLIAACPMSLSPRLRMGMRVCEHDRVGMQSLKFSQLIEATIDHHVGPPV